MGGERSALGIHDPPYNISVGRKNTDSLFQKTVDEYMDFSRLWVRSALSILEQDAHFYVWLGADQNEGFQPLPEFMLMMREFPEFRSRSFITLRNQRGYGTQGNWMAVRQELLYYIRGNPFFRVVYTDIPKVLKGYYKTVGGRETENLERSLSETIRPGNVWLDIQQVFYRMEENVPGAYAQKPLKAAERLIESSSRPGDLVTDFFAHAGTTLIAAEKLGRRCFTFDIDPVFAEITIRRLERFRETGKTGWQTGNPFPEVPMPENAATPSSSAGPLPRPSLRPSPPVSPSQGTLF
jgi:site-specific DNA-methyltransferase (adenine-specific)